MAYSKKKLREDFINLGIRPGDRLLMHSSFKSLGGVEQGAEGFYDVLTDILGGEGTLLLPTLTYRPVYDTLFFDVNTTPSCTGYLPEYFRTQMEGTIRSLHPTHSCTVWGKDAKEFVKDHELDHTPVGKNSPLAKLPLAEGKILMLGCSFDSNTSMHGVEEAGEAYYVLDKTRDPVCYRVKGYDGVIREQHVYRHTITCRQRYSRVLPLLEGDEVSYGMVLDAKCVLMSAAAVWKKGVEKIRKEPLYFVEEI